MAYTLKAEERSKDSKANAVRNTKNIPAVVYGFGIKESQSLSIPYQDFAKVFDEVGESQIVELTVGSNKPVNVLVRDVQINPVKRNMIHADFQAVDITKPVDVEVPLSFVGEAPAVKASGGSLLKKLDTVHAQCLPVDLVKSIEVDLGALKTLEDSLLVSDLPVPKGLKFLTDPSVLVAVVIAPRLELEPVQAEEAEAVPAEGTEGEPATEGETPAPEEKK